MRSLAGQGDGIPDLLCLFQGDVILVECKVKNGKLTERQINFIAEGWPVRLVRTIEDVGRFFPLVEKP